MGHKTSLIGGVVTALGTPLDARENLHEEGMRRQIQMQLEAGVDALLVMGSMGSMQLLKEDTFRQALEVTMDEVSDRIPVVVGCGDTSTERTLTRMRWAERHPINGMVLLAPFFFKFTQAELLDYFTDLASATNLPVYLYNLPACTQHTLDFDLILKLSKIGNIVGLKESGDVLTVRLCAERFGNSGDFRVLSGITPFFDVSLQMGAHGIADGLFALAPEYGVEILRSFRNGDRASAGSAQRKLSRLASVVRIDSIFAGFTAAMNLRGIPGNFAVRPFQQITAEGRNRVEAILRELELV